MVQELDGIIIIPVWSQFNINSAGISSIMTVSIRDVKKDFLISAKSDTAYLLFGCCCSSLDKIHSP